MTTTGANRERVSSSASLAAALPENFLLHHEFVRLVFLLGSDGLAGIIGAMANIT